MYIVTENPISHLLVGPHGQAGAMVDPGGEFGREGGTGVERREVCGRLKNINMAERMENKYIYVYMYVALVKNNSFWMSSVKKTSPLAAGDGDTFLFLRKLPSKFLSVL